LRYLFVEMVFDSFAVAPFLQRIEPQNRKE
jgi:hypothetical protein